MVLCLSAIVVIIEVLVAFLCCQLVTEFSFDIKVFVIGLSQILFFFSLLYTSIKYTFFACML